MYKSQPYYTTQLEDYTQNLYQSLSIFVPEQMNMMKIVSERLGYSSIEMTMNTYSHVTFDMQKESSDRFEKAFQQTN